MWAKRSLAVVIGLALVTIAADLVIAHHGWSGYDSNQVLNLQGHPRSRLRAPAQLWKLAAGDKVWLVVLAPPSRMNAAVFREMLAVGTTATVVG